VPSSPQSPPSLRTLTWDGCVNARDLGGHVAEDGRVTQFGGVVRADSVRRLSEDGWQALTDYGVRTVVDLRYQVELDRDPPRDVDLDVVHISLFGEPDEERWVELEKLGTAQGDAAGFTRVVYLEVLEEHRAKVATAVGAVGHAVPGGVVVHCHAGKDRTGLVTALLLRLAGVPIEEVALDYAESERHLASRNEEWIAEGADEAERDWRRLVTSTPAAGMSGVLQEIDRRYGDVASFLRAGGASDTDLAAARARLLDD
jgi:protein tyrosine/serine phosphatase